MQKITYDDALRALNVQVAEMGHGYVDIDARCGATCRNIRQGEDGTYTPSCIVGRALAWLGVPVEWFVRHSLFSSSIDRVAQTLGSTEAGLLEIEPQAVRLLSRAQGLQDDKIPWGEAVTKAHLGLAWFEGLEPRLDEVKA